MDQNRTNSKIKLIASNVMQFKRFYKIERFQKYYFQKTGSNRIKQDQNWSKLNKAQK